MIPLFKVACEEEAALDNIGDALASRYVGQGQWCDRLEDGLCDLLARPRVLYLNSGTSALQLAYHMAGVGPGTEVISTPITCLATNSSIVKLGAKIVWADVDPETGNIDPEDAVRRITSRTRAIVGVDWGGRVCDFGRIKSLTRGIAVIEDAAHAILSDGPARGDYVCYSLQAIKMLNTADGGALACPSAATHERAKLLRWFGLDRTTSNAMRCYQPVDEAGWKFQGNDVLAAIGCANLPKTKELSSKHRANAATLYAQLKGVPFVRIPTFDPLSDYWLFTIQVSSPARFEGYCAAKGVMVSQVHARNDIYGCFREFQRNDLPGVDTFAAHQVSIPVGWWLTEDDLQQVVQVVQSWAATPEARWSME